MKTVEISDGEARAISGILHSRANRAAVKRDDATERGLNNLAAEYERSCAEVRRLANILDDAIGRATDA